MEKYIQIPTADDMMIPGILNSKGNTDKLVIFVHGFTGTMNEAHLYSAKEYFTNKWYDVFRFNLYASGESFRKLRDCSVKMHAEDIQLVSDNFTNYSEIYFVGHSLAGPCLATVNKYPENVNKLIFWDPAFEMWTTGRKFYREWESIRYQSSWKHIEISPEMEKEFLEDNFLEILTKQDFSKQDIFSIYADWDRHVNLKPKLESLWIESCIIQWANHGFTQEWKYEELFEKTLEYINKK